MASNDLDVTQDQMEKILYFMEIAHLDDIQLCKEILESHDWSMEHAVQQQFTPSEPNPASTSRPSPVREPPTPNLNLHPVDLRVYDNRRPQSLLSWASFFALMPFKYMYTTILDIYKLISRLLLGGDNNQMVTPGTTLMTSVQSFIAFFNNKYGEIHPRFLNLSYSQALNEAKKDLKFLLIYLHGNDHEDTDDFCNNTICDPEFTSFANTNLLMWACFLNSKQGNQVSMALNETTYPFMALIVLRNGRMTVIAKICGAMRPTMLITNLTQAIADNQTSLVAARAVRDEQSMTQSIRREQDEAVELSLQQDREKAKKKQDEKLKKQQEERLIKEQLEGEERKVKEIALKKEEMRCNLPQEPDSDNPDKIDVLLKLPNGARLERRFLLTDSLEILHDYVYVHELTPDNFQIVSNFPRKVLPLKPCEQYETPPTFKQFGLGKKEMLFVQNIY